MAYWLSCSVHVGASPTRDHASVPCIARWLPNHGPTREASRFIVDRHLAFFQFSAIMTPLFKNFYWRIFLKNFYWSIESSLVAQRVKLLPAMWETQVPSLGWEDPLEKGEEPHSIILAWGIPWTEEPGGCSPRGRRESDRTERLHLHFTLWCASFYGAQREPAACTRVSPCSGSLPI